MKTPSIIILLFLFGPNLLAQITGTISGKVVSQNGDVLPGVAVVLESPQLLGTRGDVSRANGSFLFVKVPPGNYTMTATLKGMKTEKLETRVNLSSLSRPTLVMVPELSTSLEVVARGVPELDNPGVAAHFSGEFIEKMAGGRLISQAVLLAPGTSFRGTSGINISGANTGLNTYLVNGADSRFDNIFSQPSNTVVEDSIQETTVLTSSISAKYGQFLGGVINTVTKSGGNTLGGSLRQALTNSAWGARNPLEKETGSEKVDKINRTNSVTFGGPILVDRIWFFLAGQKLDRRTTSFFFRPTPLSDAAATAYGLPTGQTMPVGIIPDDGRTVSRYEGKLTALLSPGHQLILNYVARDDLARNWAASPMDATPLTDRKISRKRFNATLENSFGPNFHLEFKYSKRESIFLEKDLPEQMQQRLRAGEDITAVGTMYLDTRYSRFANFSRFAGNSEEPRNNETFSIEANSFIVSQNWGSHDLAYGLNRGEDSRFLNESLTPNNWGVSTVYYFANDRVNPLFSSGAVPGQARSSLLFAPTPEESQTSRYKVNSGYINDSWTLNDHWWFNLGFRYDKNVGTARDGIKTADDQALSPRLSASYDLFGDGRHVLRAGYAVYGQRISEVANSGSIAGNFRQTIIYYGGPTTENMADVINWVNDTYGDNFFADPLNHPNFEQFLGDAWFNDFSNVPTTVIGKIDPNGGYTPGQLKTPHADELSLGYAFRIGSRGFLRSDFVHRKFRDFYTAHTNMMTGRTSDGRTDLTVVNNDDDLYNKEYNSIQTQFSYTLNQNLGFRGNYTWSQLIGNWDGALSNGSGAPAGELTQYPELNNFPGRSPRRYLPADIRHAANLFLLYKIETRLGVFDFGLHEQIISGSPTDYWLNIRINTAERAAAYGLPLARDLGYRSGPNNTLYHVGQKRGQTTYTTNWSINWSKPLARVELFLQFDILNIFNASRYGDGSKLLNTVLNAGVEPFNVFTEVPVEGIHYFLTEPTGVPSEITNTGYQQGRSLTIDFGLRF